MNQHCESTQPEDQGLQPDKIETALRRMIAGGEVKIPPYPGVASQLARLASGDNYSLKEVARLVTSDQALAADTLRYANAAAFGATRVNSLDQAIVRIGGEQMARLAFASALSATALEGPLAELRHLLWRQALTSALVAQNLGARRRINSGDAFTCGLLHDFGKVIGVACLEQLWHKGEIARASAPLSFWQRILERTHILMGTALARTWNLSELVHAVIVCHHDIEACAAPHRQMIGLVITADNIVRLMETHERVGDQELTTMPDLYPEEGGYLTKLLPRIPPLVASMAQPGVASAKPKPKAAKAAGPRVEAPSTSLAGQRREVEATTLVVQEESMVEYRTLYMTSDGIAIGGDASLPVNGLVQLRIVPPGEDILTVWARVVLCATHDGAVRIELRPFGLGGGVKVQWDRLYAAAAAAA